MSRSRMIWELSATEIARGVSRRTFSCTDVIDACLDRIHKREATVQAWAHLDADKALDTARRLDDEPPRSPLHGVPIGLKDIIDTADMPTAYGSEAFTDHQLDQDAVCVSRLRNAGAVILGKTVTTEFAYYAPGPTTNPHHRDHTPGGSSSGSAAAVADFHVPLALGTQTAGSIIRPASFNGVIGYKPSHGTYPLDGVLPLAPSLDTLGVFCRDVADLNACNQVLANEPDYPMTGIEPPQPTKVGIIRGPDFNHADDDARAVFEQFVCLLVKNEIQCADLHYPEIPLLINTQIELLASEAVATLGPFVTKFGNLIRPQTTALVTEGRAVPNGFAKRHAAAVEAGNHLLDKIFSEVEVVVALSAPGTAPAGLSATGDPIFNRLWTFLGTPCVNIPVGLGNKQLPIGIQVIGQRAADATLLPVAACLAEYASFNIAPP